MCVSHSWGLCGFNRSGLLFYFAGNCPDPDDLHMQCKGARCAFIKSYGHNFDERMAGRICIYPQRTERNSKEVVRLWGHRQFHFVGYIKHSQQSNSYALVFVKNAW